MPIRKNITIGEQQGVTLLEFGLGDIAIAAGFFPEENDKRTSVCFWADKEKPVEQWGEVPIEEDPHIGKASDKMPNLVEFRFYKVESIDNIIHHLQKAKQWILTGQKGEVPAKRNAEEIPPSGFMNKSE